MTMFKTLGEFYENHKKNIIAIIIIVTVLLGGVLWARGSVYKSRLESTRREYSEYRESVVGNESNYRELAKEFEQSEEYLSRIKSSINSSIKTARDAINLIEEIRAITFEMENNGSDFWDKYYSYWDSVFNLEK